MKRISVLLVDDHTILRQGLRSLLESRREIEVIGEAEDGHQAVEKAIRLKPNVVILDISLPSLSGLEVARRIKKEAPQVHILILTVHVDEEYIFQALKAGASGYLVKKAAADELIMAIEVIQRGEVYLSPSISGQVVKEYLRGAEKLREKSTFDALTHREQEVLKLIAEGSVTREIAKILNVSPRTVESHRAHIMTKLGAHKVTDLVKYAIRRGIIDAEG